MDGLHSPFSVSINDLAIDQEIATYSSSFLPPLPTETLETIFILGAREYYSESPPEPIPTAPSWVNVSYVCRRWRNVALHCATLWTHLFNTSPRWTEELLVRSKQASLKLNVKLRSWDDRCPGLRFFKQVINHLERIQELRLHLHIPNYEVALSKLFSRAPCLEHLKISIHRFPTELSSPFLLFGGDTPVLRTLELDGPVSWCSLKLTGLTTLSLHHIPAQFQQSIPDFLASLRCMQHLKDLCLYNSLPSAVAFLSSAAFYRFQKINLSHLSQLWINAPVSAVTALLSCITVPLETRVKLGPDCLVDYESRIGDYTPLFSLLTQRYGTLKDQAVSRLTIRSLSIQCHLDRLVILSFRTSEREPPVSTSRKEWWSSDLPLEIFLPFGRSMTSERDHLVSHTCRSISMSNVQRIHIAHPPTSLAFWTDLLGYCSSLRQIRLSYGDMPQLVPILSLTPRNDTDDQCEPADRGQRRILAPALEELELHGTIFRTRNGTDLGPLNDTSVQSLCDALSTRKWPRGRLTMTLCGEFTDASRLRRFDMEGRWEGGRFFTVSHKDYGYL